jgi:hypothetical protein
MSLGWRLRGKHDGGRVIKMPILSDHRIGGVHKDIF